MTIDNYAGSAQRWAEGAALVYAPLARELVATSPHPLASHRVLDAGAGTGVASVALGAVGALPVAVDLSHDMLRSDRLARPPSAVADLRALPLADACVDDAVAGFVLNHLTEPGRGLDELCRVTRPGGAVLACVYANASRSEARDRIDQAALAAGWQVPGWYRHLKAEAVPLLGSAGPMADAARAAGLVDVSTDERPVDIGLTRPDQLVDYRFGQAHYTDWFASMDAERAATIRAQAIEAVGALAEPYRPIVVFLAGCVPGR